MIYIKEINVTSKYTVTSLYVEIKIEDTYFNLDDYIFDLYRSNSQTEGYELIASDIKDFNYLDTSVNLLNIETDFFYKVKVTKSDLSESQMSEVYGEYKGGKSDNYSEAILHIHNIYVNRVIDNSPVKVLKKIRFGQLCSCYDDVRRRSNPRCLSCYGTKYEGGYYDPFEVMVNYISSRQKTSEMFTPANVTDEEPPIQFWTLAYPKFGVQDVIVDRNNSRYEITDRQPSIKKNYVFRQTFQAVLLPKTNLIYKYQID